MPRRLAGAEQDGNLMDENQLHQWMLDAFGPFEGEQAWQQFQKLPDNIKQQLLENSATGLPDPQQLRSFFTALNASGLRTMSDMDAVMKDGPIIVDMSKALADERIRQKDYQPNVTARDADDMRAAVSEANLWLDSTMIFDPAPGSVEIWTREQWADKTLPRWAKLASPVVGRLCSSLADVFQQRFGDQMQGEVSGLFAGPVPIPIPDSMRNPGTIMRFVGSMSFSLQLGAAAGEMAAEVRGSYDQGLPMGTNAAGALIVQNVKEYAHQLDIDVHEVMSFLALIEVAHARLYAAVPWLPSRFETLIYKYARSTSIDLDSMESQLRDAAGMDPESISGAVNLSNVAAEKTPEQREVLKSIENLLALVEGWVDCVVWRAGMAHLPHLDQLLEMRRRERATGGPAEQTLESLLGLEIHPRTIRQAADVWSAMTADGVEDRDAHWNHPDLLPSLGGGESEVSTADDGAVADADAAGASADDGAAASTDGADETSEARPSIDWDAELEKLLSEDGGDGNGDDGDTPEGSGESDDDAHND